MSCWYLIRTKAAKEATAKANLERQGYEVYAPRVLQVVRRRLRWNEMVVPLFPRYLFLRLSEGLQAFGPVRSTLGVAEIVRFGARFAVVPDQVVSELRARADAETGLHRLNSGGAFATHQRVRIAMGPLRGLEGVFERDLGAERVVVLLMLLGQEAPVRIRSSYLVPVRA